MSAQDAERPVLLTGATGYVGGKLRPRLEATSGSLTCLARDPRKLQGQTAPGARVVAGDVLDRASLVNALRGVHTAYYLVHMMADSAEFEARDRQGAENFAAATRDAGVQRIIYLSGLGDESDPDLSPHLRSRHEVGAILRESGVETIELRAGMVIGAGSLSFRLLQSLTDRLPVMLCPSWLRTPTQPIAVEDAVAYLLASRDLPTGASRVFEIGAEDVVTYGDLIQEYARQRGLTRWLIPVPFLTPYLSGLWLALVTPATYDVGRHLIEGLTTPMLVRDDAAKAAFSIEPLGVSDAIARALAPED